MNAGKTVLIVDDDHDIIESLTLIVESAGYGAVAAESVDECFTALDRCRPDAIVLDIMLETLMDGLTLGSKIRSDPRFGDVPIIVISSLEEYASIPVRGHTEAANAFLTKPVAPDKLLYSLHSLID